MLARDPREVIAKLELSLGGLLRHIHVGAGLHGRKVEQRLGGDTQNLIGEVLEVEREHIQLGGAECVAVIGDKAVKLVIVRIAAS